MLTFEREYWAQGIRLVAGVDEAGRGPLAGPVVAAAVVLDPDWALDEEDASLSGLTDSKQLSESSRVAFAALLRSSPHVRIGLGVAESAVIDRINILRATHQAMAQAVSQLDPLPDLVLVDGLPVSGLPCPSRAIVRGDTLSLSIAAASVMAKVVRDARMRELDDAYPAYGFRAHKGYGTEAHLRALYEHGPCPEHRRTFAPVREAEANRGGLGQRNLW